MAEHSFREVMYEVNRLCTANSNCDQDCPLRNMGCCGNLGTHCSDPLQAERIENTVMAWAAEHPEPVYPTWHEYLAQNDILEVTCASQTTSTTSSYPQARYIEKVKTLPAFYRPIPADIAAKLGLEPKERNNDKT